MHAAAEFQRVCDLICSRLATDERDVDVFETLHSSQFSFWCALMGLDPEEVVCRIYEIAAQRKTASRQAG